MLKELRDLGYRSVCLGSYVAWDARKQSEIIQRELGWTGDRVENVPPEYNYEKIECYMQGVRDYIKYIKRGYSRPSHLVALDIRHGRITKEEGEKLVKEYEGKRPPSLDLFLEFVGLTESEFIDIAQGHQVSPYSHNPKTTESGEKTEDFENWSREGSMDRAAAKDQVNRWKSRNI
jgi:hypothetical protein